jgi:hypothetical protein
VRTVVSIVVVIVMVSSVHVVDVLSACLTKGDITAFVIRVPLDVCEEKREYGAVENMRIKIMTWRTEM